MPRVGLRPAALRVGAEAASSYRRSRHRSGTRRIAQDRNGGRCTSMSYIFFLLSVIATQASAQPKDYSFPPHEMIEVAAYDKAKNVYELIYLKYPRQGPFFATPKSLALGVGAIELSRIQNSPTSILHQQFKTDKAIPLVPDEAMFPASRAKRQ